MNFKNSKKVIIAAAISTSVLFASNQAYASEAPDENSKEILDAVKDDSVDDAIKDTIKEIDQLETTQQAPQSDPTDEQNLEEQTEDKEKSLSDNNEELKDFTLDNGGEIPLADTSDADDSDIDTIDEEFGNLASVDDLDPVNDLAPVEDDLDGLEPLGEDSEPVNGNTGANPIEDDFEDVPPIPEEDTDGEETETEELPVDEEEPPIPNEDPDPIDETTENLSGKTTIELETELIGIDNQKIDIESLPEEVEIEFTYGGKTQTKTIKREELYGLIELTNFDFKDEEDLKQKLKGRLDIGDGKKLDLTFTYDPNAIKQDENNKTIARVPLKIHQLFNPNLEVEFKDPDGNPYDNKDEIPIFIRWGENGSEYRSTLTTNPGVDEDKYSNDFGLVFDDNKYVEERSKTPTIIVRDDVAGDQVLTPDTKSFIYNGKTYNIKGINIDPINGAKITPSAIANGEREIDGGRRVEDILFEIERSENENLPTGEVKIIQEGKKGKRVYQEYQPTLDGDDYGNPVERE
ncbi:MAG: G5 domain-containing protein, partial [Anaerococcus sp.]|nr:G5 domain-containing protein [Anaerococcus sp.]